MEDAHPHRGPGVFGPAYRVLFENDASAPGSVGRVLLERMIRIGPESAVAQYGGEPRRAVYRGGSRPGLERFLREIGADTTPLERPLERLVDALARACRQLGDHEPDALVFGGREEEIIARGSSWCTDVSRVACALAQVAGLPSRIATLVDTDRPYCAHSIVEIRRGGAWGAVDPVTAVIYRRADGSPASVWDLVRGPALVEAHRRGEETPYTTPDQFRAGALSEYGLDEAHALDFTVTGPNAYYESILAESARGWPGGLRWLHGEDDPPRGG